MTNFLKETADDIKRANKTEKDIVFIGSLESGYACKGWDHFKNIANFEYDSGYGSPKIAEDLIIVFSDGSHLRRQDYDGSESWEFIDIIKIPSVTRWAEKLGGNECLWDTLQSMNERKTDD